jgi:LL-diaminopimelate aminotransferase
MARLNSYYKKLSREYIFPIIEEKLSELQKKSPQDIPINLGVGDIALPLAPSIAHAICKATQEMTTNPRGYGPSDGYLFLKEAILKNQYAHLGISTDEIFISDGTNTDAASIQELFSLNNIIGILDPTYPVYLDTNIMAGRSSKIRLLPCTKDNGFCPSPPQEHCDVVYLCTPNNPTGVAFTRAALKEWILYAQKEKAILVIDHAYDAFVTSPDVPQTIFEIEGAKDVAIEFKSFSKSAGFTGLRCAYTVLPKSVHNGELHPMWKKRQSTKSNGVSYPIQKGAEAVFSSQGRQETRAQVAAYLEEAKRLKEGLTKMGYTCFGGTDSPFIWWKTPQNLTSWEFFDLLLDKCQIISVPGSGFGKHGEGYVRLSAFTTPNLSTLALEKICNLL